MDRRTKVATFQPKRLDTLRDRAKPFIGATLEWMPMWVVDEDDGGDYVGQTVWMPTDDTLGFIGWVPDEDLIPA